MERTRFVILLFAFAACSSPSVTDAGTLDGAADSSADAPSLDVTADVGAMASCVRDMAWRPRTFAGPQVFLSATAAAGGDGSTDHPFNDMQQAIDAAPDGATIVIGAGSYAAAATPYTDPTCGNCLPTMPTTPAATRGFVITGKSLALVGSSPTEVVLRTHAGYGVFIEDACEVQLSNLTISNGIRDADGNASDGAIFVRRSRAVVRNVTVRNNLQLLPGNAYPGIAGIMCREDSDVLVMASTIRDNGWDGISVYQDGRLRVFGTTIARGNGVAIGATWNGQVLALSNDLSGYWKGIGAFVSAHVVARNNTIHGQLGWGMWVAQQGYLEATNNTIAYNDQLGVYLADPGTSGTLVNNIVAFNGLNTLGGYTPDVFGRGGVRGPTGAMPSVQATYNDIASNQLSDWVAGDGMTPVPMAMWPAGNLSTDPDFVSPTDLHLAPGSPMHHAGDPSIHNPDGSRSDLGATGGPDVGRMGP